MKPKVSVIIPTYNRIQLIGNAVDSILAQSFGAHEVIVVDDGSTDGTGRFLQRKYAERVRYLGKTNEGPSVARNAGLELVTGDWVGFLDSDDLWCRDKLEWQLRALAVFPECGVCFTNAQFINDPRLETTTFAHAGKSFAGEIGKLPDTLRFVANPPHGIWSPTLIARTEIIRQIGGFDSNLTLCEDDDFIFRLGTVTQFCFVNRPLALFDRSGNRHIGISKMWHKSEYCLSQDQYRFEKRLTLGVGLPADVRRLTLARLRAVHSAWANWYLVNGQYKKAREAVSTAVAYDFTLKIAAKWILTIVCPKFTEQLVQSRSYSSAPSAPH